MKKNIMIFAFAIACSSTSFCQRSGTIISRHLLPPTDIYKDATNVSGTGVFDADKTSREQFAQERTHMLEEFGKTLNKDSLRSMDSVHVFIRTYHYKNRIAKLVYNIGDKATPKEYAYITRKLTLFVDAYVSRLTPPRSNGYMMSGLVDDKSAYAACGPVVIRLKKK